MNIIKKLFHFHKWKTIKRIPWRVYTETVTSGGSFVIREDDTDGAMVLQKCEICDVECAYITNGTVDSSIDVDYAKLKMGLN